MYLSFFSGDEEGVGEKNKNDQMVITGSMLSPDHDRDIFSNMYYYYLYIFKTM